MTSPVSNSNDKASLHLISCGYLRKYFNEKNANPKDIAQIIVSYLYQDWKFEYFGDDDNYGENRSKTEHHGIYNNGKTIKCNDEYYCFCFYRVSLPMIPNSGIYNIKFKCDKLNGNYQCNAIGITSNAHESNNSQSFTNYWFYSQDYIAWSAFGEEDDDLPNGLLCGFTADYQDKNIFVVTKSVYKSNNQYYKQRLPGFKTGDTIVLQYDSNNNRLSFFKSNDDKLNACITNLPKDKTFYWIVGHQYGLMEITIVQ